MLAGRHLQGTEDIVHTPQLGFLAVNRHRPAGIVYLTEDNDTASCAFYAIGKFVGVIVRQFHTSAVQRTALQLRFEATVGDGGTFGVEVVERSHLFVGVLHKREGVDEPSVAVGVGVADGECFAARAEDEIFRVEHVQTRGDAISRDERHVTLILVDGSDEVLEFRVESSVDEVLIAVQFSSVIATDGVMIVGRGVGSLVERIPRSEVGDAEVGCVRQNLFVRRCFGEGSLHVVGIGEGGVVEIAFVNLPEVHKAEQGDCHAEHHRPAGLMFLLLLHHRGNEEEDEGHEGYLQERGSRRGREDGMVHGGDGIPIFSHKVGGEACLRHGGKGAGVRSGEAVAGGRGSKPHQQTQSACQHKRHGESDALAPASVLHGPIAEREEVGATHNGGEAENRQGGHGELDDDEGRADGAELGIERQVVDEEVRHLGRVLAP